jgi:predicted dehydrogenase
MIGLGKFAALHARVWEQLQDVEVVAVCDRNPQAFAAFTEKFPSARCYSDWKAMIDAESLDAVDILTPEHLHAEPVLYALQAGLHVFVEKPLAADPEEAERLVKFAEERGRILMTGHILRFDTRYAAAKLRTARGDVGTVRSIYAKRNNGKQFFSVYNRISPIFILGIHDIDMMHWIMEDNVCEVRSLRSSSGHETEDLIWTMLRFTRGGIGILENNWLLPDGAASFADVRMEITGDAGSIIVRDPEQGMEYIGGASIEQQAFLTGYELHGKVGGPLLDELAHFAEQARLGRPSAILRPADAAKAVRVAAAARLSALQDGKPVRLDGEGL